MLKKLKSHFSIMGELLSFLWKEKMWWMIPMMIILLLVGVLIFLSQSTPVAPFIYTLF